MGPDTQEALAYRQLLKAIISSEFSRMDELNRFSLFILNHCSNTQSPQLICKQPGIPAVLAARNDRSERLHNVSCFPRNHDAGKAE